MFRGTTFLCFLFMVRALSHLWTLDWTVMLAGFYQRDMSEYNCTSYAKGKLKRKYVCKHSHKFQPHIMSPQSDILPTESCNRKTNGV